MIIKLAEYSKTHKDAFNTANKMHYLNELIKESKQEISHLQHTVDKAQNELLLAAIHYGRSKRYLHKLAVNGTDYIGLVK